MSYYRIIDGSKKEWAIEADDMIVDRRAPNEHYTLFFNTDKETGKRIEVAKYKNLRDYELVLDPKQIKKLKNVVRVEKVKPEEVHVPVKTEDIKFCFECKNELLDEGKVFTSEHVFCSEDCADKYGAKVRQ